MKRDTLFAAACLLVIASVFAIGAFAIGYQVGELTRYHWLAP